MVVLTRLQLGRIPVLIYQNNHIDNLLIAVYSLPMERLTSLSVDEILLTRHVYWSTNFDDLPYRPVLALSHHQETCNSKLFSFQDWQANEHRVIGVYMCMVVELYPNDVTFQLTFFFFSFLVFSSLFFFFFYIFIIGFLFEDNF